jgi:radical SAM superfamily enzyme YgiQ (UPF0313 family)
MYEQGVIRPPSEASSLLVRVTRNCPWNQCLFCASYKKKKFSRRTVEEVKKDIDNMAREYEGYPVRTVFLQDGDTLVLKTDDVLEIVRYMKQKFPAIERITSYARAPTLKRRSVEELKQLKEAGLTRLHVGMESGSEKVLKMIKKGITGDDIIIGGRHVKEAGIELSEYIMPGVGGRSLSEEHALETARILNMVQPGFIRVRTFAMHRKSPMQKMVENNTFVPMTDEEIIREIRLLLENLSTMHSYFSCGDHSLNLLMHVNGYLDENKEQMLKDLDDYLSLSKEQKQAYSLLKRGSYGNLSIEVVRNEDNMKQIRPELERIEKTEKGGIDGYLNRLRDQLA